MRIAGRTPNDREPSRPAPSEPASEPPPDLHTQWEDLLETVRWSEANWRFDDLLDLAVQLQPPRRPAA